MGLSGEFFFFLGGGHLSISLKSTCCTILKAAGLTMVLTTFLFFSFYLCLH